MVGMARPPAREQISHAARRKVGVEPLPKDGTGCTYKAHGSSKLQMSYKGHVLSERNRQYAV